MRKPISYAVVLGLFALACLLPQQATTATTKPATTVDLAAPHDGTTDASPAIQTAVKNVGANGLRLRVHDGRYVLHSPVLVPSNVWIEGAGRGAEFVTDVAGSRLLIFDGVSNARVSGMKLTGHGDWGADTSRGVPVSVVNSSDIEVSNNDISGHAFAGILLIGDVRVTVAHNRLHDGMNTTDVTDPSVHSDILAYGALKDSSITDNSCTSYNDHGISFQPQATAASPAAVEHNIVAHNYVANKNAYGVNLYVSTYGPIRENVVRENTIEHVRTRRVVSGLEDVRQFGAGIYLAGAIPDPANPLNARNQILNNSIFDVVNDRPTQDSLAAAAIEVVTAPQTTIRGNLISGSRWWGIWVSSDTGTVDGSLIADNQISDCDRGGILLAGVSGFEVSRNRIRNVTGTGIYLLGQGLKNGSVAENSISRASGDGIQAAPGAASIDISTNEVSYSGDHGIAVAGPDTHVRENRVWDSGQSAANAYSGISASSASNHVAGLIIRDNTAFDDQAVTSLNRTATQKWGVFVSSGFIAPQVGGTQGSGNISGLISIENATGY